MVLNPLTVPTFQAGAAEMLRRREGCEPLYLIQMFLLNGPNQKFTEAR